MIHGILMTFPCIMVLTPMISELMVLLNRSQRAGIHRYLHPNAGEGLNVADHRAIARANKL